MSLANEILLSRFFESCNDAESASNPVDEFCAPTFVLHDASTGEQGGCEAIKEILGSWRTAFPDARVEVGACVARGNEVETRWRWTGTHERDFRGVPATRRRVVQSGTLVCHVAEGRLTEAWIMIDAGHLFRMPEAEARRDGGYKSIPIASWSKFVELVTIGDFQFWAFRGQRQASWPMESSLSRHLLKRRIHRSLWSEQEERIIRIFRRKAHLFLQHLPAPGDTFQWLALMQHHGAPTRLLDFTWSPYVAAFFALEHAEKEAAVWAVHTSRLTKRWPATARCLPPRVIDGVRTVSINPRNPGTFERVYLPGTASVVSIAEPDMMNQRLIAQQGTFVIPGRLDRPVETILGEYDDSESLIAKFILHPGVRDEAMRELLNMNITNATLFPGLDGLARSMTYELEFHWGFDLRTGERR